MKFLSIILLALLGSVSLAQERLGPPKQLSQEFPSYELCAEQLRQDRLPFVAFVGIPGRQVGELLTCEIGHLFRENRWQTKAIAVIHPNGHEWLPANAGDVAILRAAFGRQVSQPADPFSLQLRRVVVSPPPIAEGSPWLSRAERKKIENVWPGAFPEGLEFYNLEKLYQAASTENNGRDKFNIPTNISDHETKEFSVSGGMAEVHTSLWKSVKGLDIPPGSKIKVWKEDTNVRAYSSVPLTRWRFPEGTVAYDVLLDDEGKPFEIRSQVKTAKGWKTIPGHKNPSRFPPGYVGLRQSCASCHDRTEELVTVPGRIYLRPRWGGDGRFSWRPFDESGKLDFRWPIEVDSSLARAEANRTRSDEEYGIGNGMMENTSGRQRSIFRR